MTQVMIAMISAKDGVVMRKDMIYLLWDKQQYHSCPVQLACTSCLYQYESREFCDVLREPA